MNTENTLRVKFNAHETLSDLLVVNHILHDGTEPIGRVYRHFCEEGITYTGISKDGEQIISTEDWIAVEIAFEQFAKQHAELSRREKIESMYMEAGREDEIQNLRRRKKEIAKSMAITK